MGAFDAWIEPVDRTFDSPLSLPVGSRAVMP